MTRRSYNKPAIDRSWPLWLAPARLVFATGYKIVGCRFETMYSRASFGGRRKTP